MSFLHDELAKLKAAIGGAFNFADPEAYIAEKEAAFKRSIADAVASLEERVEALEGHPALSIPALESAALPAAAEATNAAPTPEEIAADPAPTAEVAPGAAPAA